MEELRNIRILRAIIFTTLTGKLWCQSAEREIGSEVEHNGFYKQDFLRICCAIETWPEKSMDAFLLFMLASACLAKRRAVRPFNVGTILTDVAMPL